MTMTALRDLQADLEFIYESGDRFPQESRHDYTTPMEVYVRAILDRGWRHAIERAQVAEALVEDYIKKSQEPAVVYREHRGDEVVEYRVGDRVAGYVEKTRRTGFLFRNVETVTRTVLGTVNYVPEYGSACVVTDDDVYHVIDNVLDLERVPGDLSETD